MADLLRTNSAFLTDAGRKRENNEDYVESFEPAELEELQASGCLYIIADGVGGASQGERASQYAVKKVLHDYYQQPQVPPDTRLEQAMLAANRDIYNYSHREDLSIQMATTMVAAVVISDQLIVASVGDSRAYLIHNNQIQQITRDHSLVGERLQDGTLTEEESIETKIKNQLTRSLGGEADVRVDKFINITLIPGDRIVLCTDGVTRYALKNDILQLAGSGTSAEAASKLVNFAYRSGGADNITVLVVLLELAENVAQTMSIRASSSSAAPADVVELDTFIPGVSPRRRRPSVQSARRSQFPPIGFLYGGGALVLVMVIFFGALILSGNAQSADRTPTLSTPSERTLPVRVTAIGNEATRIIILTPGSITPVEGDLAPKVTFSLGTQTALLTQSSTPIKSSSTTTTPDPAWTCLYQVVQGDILSTIAGTFNLPTKTISSYYAKDTCIPNLDLKTVKCTGSPIRIENPNQIDLGWWLVIPKESIPDKAFCSNKRGFVLSN